MKNLVKYITLVMTGVFLLSIFAFSSFAQTSEVTVEKNINLAYHKEVKHSANDSSASVLTDGRYNTSAVSGIAAADETFMIDLERFAAITEIKLWPIQSGVSVSGEKMSNIAIEASVDGNQWVTLATQESITSSLTKDDALVYEAENKEYYRYVRVRKTLAGAYEYGELEIFADVKAIEISRGKSVSATSESSAAPTVYSLASAVDGVTTAYGWLVENDLHGEKCISIDLGEELVADWIEMYTRRGTVAGAAYHRNWIAYGLLDGDEEYILTPDGVGTQLFTSLATSAKEMNFPVNIEANDPNNHLYETLDGKTPYRYFSFRKTDFYLGLAEVGIFAIKPEVISSSMEGKTISLNFSEKMDVSTFENIEVKVDGVAVDANIVDVDDYTAQIELDKIYYSKRVDVIVTDAVKSERGYSAHNTVEINYFPQAVEVTGPVFINGTDENASEITALEGNDKAGVSVIFKNNQPDMEESVVLILALYDENNTLVSLKEKRVVLLPESEPENIVTGFDLPDDTEGYTLSVYIWKNFSLTKPWIVHKTIS